MTFHGDTFSKIGGGLVLGKGLSSASLAYLLQSYKVGLEKLDPYLMYPGTMSPFTWRGKTDDEQNDLDEDTTRDFQNSW